jgi:O-antigen/teichoic acid export membrane protein
VFDTVPAEYHLLAQWLVPFLAVSVWLGAVGSVFSSVLSSHDRFDLTRRVDLTILFLRAAATVTLLSLGYGLVALAFVSVGSQVLGLVGNYYCAKRIYPQLRAWPVLFNRFRLKELLGYGLLAVVSTVSVQIIGRTDLVIAGAAISVSAVAVYSVGASLVYYATASLGNVKRTLFPDIQRSAARGELGSVRWLYLRAARIQMVIGVLAFVGMIVFAEPFIRLWMGGPEFGDEAVRQAALVMQILAMAKLSILFRGASVQVLNALGRVRVTAVLTSAEAALNLALSLVFVLVLDWGLLGIAAGTLVSRLLAGTFLLPWYACAKTGTSWPGYVLRIGGSCVLSSAAFAAVCLAVRQFAYPETWVVFFVEVGIATLLWPAIAFFLVLPDQDRKRILRRLGFPISAAVARP